MNGLQARGDAVALPIVPQQNVRTINQLFKARQPLTLRVGSLTLRVAPQWQDAELATDDVCTVTFNSRSGEAELVVSKALLNAVLADLDPTLSFDSVDGHQRAILIEHALGNGLQALEAAMGAKLAIADVTPGGSAEPASAGHTTLPFQLQVDDVGQSACVLRLPSADAASFVEVLDRAVPRESGLLDIPVSVSVRWAAVAMTLGELRALMPGDIILADNACEQPGQAVAVIGEHLTVPVSVAADGVRMNGRPRRVQGSGWEWSLDKLRYAGTTPANARIDDTPVQVLFEYGRGDLTLSEVTRLGGGASLPVGVRDALDIVVNGMRIGRGEPTQIGAATGVRVTRLITLSP